MKFELTPIERKFLRQTLANERDADCVVLLGSVARRTRTSSSGDLDLLVINGSTQKLLHPGIQTTALTATDLEQRVLSGDDFAQWALRFGVALRGRSKWKELQAGLLSQAPWPNADMKRQQAVRRLARATELLEMNDLDAAQEELLYAASHLARARLLSAGVFPLSRPELAMQLRTVGGEQAADLLDSLDLQNQLSQEEIAHSILRVRELAEH